MKNTYWNHHGKYQAQVNEIEQLLPSYGYTYNRNMNLFIYVSHLYYDSHNNGGGNIMDCYASHYEKYVPEELRKHLKLEFFTTPLHDKAERAMDTVLEFLKGADLHYIRYTLWRNNATKLYCLNHQDGDGWFEVTFGSLVEKVNYIKDMERSLGYTRLTPPKTSPFEAVPAYCSRCGEFLYYSTDNSVAEVMCMHCGYFHADIMEHGKVVELYHNDGFGSCCFTGSIGFVQRAIPFPYSREKAMEFFIRCKSEYEGEITEAKLIWWDPKQQVFLTLIDEKSGK